MAVNKVTLNNEEVLIDLTSDTISEDVVLEGYTGHDASGEPFTGKLSKDADTIDGYHIQAGSNIVAKTGYISFIG